MRVLPFLLSLCLTGAVFADDFFPKPDWKDAIDPLSSPLAVPGGEITFSLSQEPKSFNGYVDNFVHVGLIFGMQYESLLGGNAITLEDEPAIANRWSISDDKKTFTFWIDPRARWSDGKPITAQDVKYTFDAVMACPDAAPWQVDLGRFDSPKVIDDSTVVFTAKSVHWSNLDTCGGFYILPKHMLETKVDRAAVPAQVQAVRSKMAARARLNDDDMLKAFSTELGADYLANVLDGMDAAGRTAWIAEQRASALAKSTAANDLLFWDTEVGKNLLNQFNFEFPVISGPYRQGRRDIGVSLEMVKRTDWWQKDFLMNQRKLNFARLNFKFFDDDNNALEAFKQGNIDIYPVYSSKFWVQDTKGEKFDKNWIVKQKVYNYDPIGFQGFAMNLRRPMFQDKRVRLALYHLLDREKMNETLMFKQYAMLSSYYPDLYDNEHPLKNTYVGYDLEKARSLLKEAGWVVNEATGNLEKGGKPFIISVLTRDSSTGKFWSLYAEDLKKVGIQLKIDQKDLNAWSKDMDTFNFDMTWCSYGAGVRKDPEGMWSSKEADKPSSGNVVGFRNKEVDALIEKQKTNFDIKERHEIVRQIDEIVYKEHPYLLLWFPNYTRMLYWNKFGTPDWVLSKYGAEYASLTYWWLDPDSQADLKDAMQNGDSLPPKPFEVHFDKLFESAK